ncbi:MAG: hypothetical protein D6705_01025 [Deltaproteobacteria bacterium]|nr:MAG: hypothetical protein D6705_01025 [Deltaproteobacteria bacterium]
MTGQLAWCAAMLSWLGPAGGPADTEDVGVVEASTPDPTVFPDPDDFATGLAVEAAAGPAAPLGATQRLLGPALGATARLGYEIRRWVAVQVAGHVQSGFYDDGVIVHEPFQQFTYTAETRFAVPFRRFAIGLQGGAGVFHVSSNLLQIGGLVPDPRRYGFAWDASLFFDVHTLSKGFSLGLVTTFVGTPRFQQAGTLFVQLYLRLGLGASTAERRARRRAKQARPDGDRRAAHVRPVPARQM